MGTSLFFSHFTTFSPPSFLLMNACISQQDFADYAAAWATFIANASADEVQRLFQPDAKQVQLRVSFDLPDTIIPLLSTVNIAQVKIRFVLLPTAPRFGLVVYAANTEGGRVSAYFLGTAQWEELEPQLTACANVAGSPTPALDGLVPFNLIKTWLCNWGWAVSGQQLSPAMFATSYGPLRGYTFELSDFLDPLFQTQAPKVSAVRANFGLKSYYPAFPEQPAQPTSTFGLVLRLYSPGGSNLGGESGGPSYDMSKPSPPY